MISLRGFCFAENLNHQTKKESQHVHVGFLVLIIMMD